MDSNKIRYGFKNVYYALLKELEGNVTFDTPKPWKGAKSLTLDPEGETNIFYADDIAYNTENINNGYTGSIEMAYLTDAVKEDIFNYVKTKKEHWLKMRIKHQIHLLYYANLLVISMEQDTYSSRLFLQDQT